MKLVKNMAEDSRVAVRNVRRDIIQDLKDLKKEGEISEDDEHRAEEEVQKLTERRHREDQRTAHAQGSRDPRDLM